MRRLLACLLAVCVAVASAAFRPTYAEGLPAGWHMVSAKEAAALAANVRASAQYEALANALTLGYAAEAEPIILGHGDQAFVYYPIRFQDKNNGSLFMAVVDQKTGEILDSMTWLVEKAADAHRARVWMQSVLAIDATIDDSGTVRSGWYLGADGKRVDAAGVNLVKVGTASLEQHRTSLLGSQTDGVQTQSLRCLNDCLSAAGVPMFLITLVAMVCAVACAVTAGLGCAICLGGTLGAWASIGSYCLRRCGYSL